MIRGPVVDNVALPFISAILTSSVWKHGIKTNILHQAFNTSIDNYLPQCFSEIVKMNLKIPKFR